MLAHNWDQAKLSMDVYNCIEAVERIASQENHQQTLWLRHWKDPEQLPLPEGWIKTCNAITQTPGFLMQCAPASALQ